MGQSPSRQWLVEVNKSQVGQILETGALLGFADLSPAARTRNYKMGLPRFPGTFGHPNVDTFVHHITLQPMGRIVIIFILVILLIISLHLIRGNNNNCVLIHRSRDTTFNSIQLYCNINNK